MTPFSRQATGADAHGAASCSSAPWPARVCSAPALAGCAGPNAQPPPAAPSRRGTLSLALNRSLVSLDNKLNQFDAAVTVQRAVRQALTRIGPGTHPELVLAEPFEHDRSPPQWTVKLREGSATPTAARSRSRTSPRP